MADPLNHAKNTLARVHSEVRAYMPDLFMRIAFNYSTIFLVAVLISIVLVNILSNFIWESTANTITFVTNLALLVYGWRWLENRNLATTLFISYTHYSKHRRELLKAIDQSTAGTLADSNQLYTLVDDVEQSGNQFVALAEQQNMKRLEKEKR